MSHMTKLKIAITSKGDLCAALGNMGHSIVEKDGLKDYYANTSEERVDFTLEGQPTIGFRQVQDGTWEFVGDFYGTGMREKEFMQELGTEYNVAKYEKLVKSKGKRMTRTKVGNAVTIKVMM